MGNCRSRPVIELDPDPEDTHNDNEGNASSKAGAQSRSDPPSTQTIRRHPTNPHHRTSPPTQHTPTTSRISSTSILHPNPAQTRQHQWSTLFHSLSPHIVDPSDVQSVLDEAVSRTIRRLGAAETTLIVRRVRKTVRSLLYATGKDGETAGSLGLGGCVPGSGGGGGPNGSSLGGVVTAVVGGGVTTATASERASETDESMEPNHHNRHRPIPPPTPVRINTTPATASDTVSRDVYQKEHLLDEHMFRKIFIAGHRRLRVGAKEGWATRSREEWKKRTERRRKKRRELQPGTSRSFGDEADDRTLDETQRSTNSSTVTRSTPTSLEVGDPIGTAYVALLYLSEQRWDYVAEIAKISAKKAGLELDVNHLVSNNHDDDHNNNNNSDGNNNSNNVSASIYPNNKPLPPPTPSKLTSSASHYAGSPGDSLRLPSPPPNILPSGVSLQEISLVVALALRSGRQQRLRLLFTLLLRPKTLARLLDVHMAGGVPTWLLEVDGGWILSFASLSHYYHHGGAGPNGLGGSTTTAGNDSKEGDTMNHRTTDNKNHTQRNNKTTVPAPKELRVNVLSTLETIAVLLHTPDDGSHDLHHSSSTTTTTSNSNTNNVTKSSHIPPSPHPRRDRVLSYGDKNYRSARAHVMMAQYLREVPTAIEPAPDTVYEDPEEVGARLSLLDRFWEASESDYRMAKKKQREGLATTIPNSKRSASRTSLMRKKASMGGGSCTESIGSAGSGSTSATATTARGRKRDRKKRGSQRKIDDDYDENEEEGDAGRRKWTLDEFLAWADRALPDDAAVDVVMNQLFGMGLLPTPAMERTLVSHAWMSWEDEHQWLLDKYMYEGTEDDEQEEMGMVTEGQKGEEEDGAISVVSQGIRNLFSLPPGCHNDDSGGHRRSGNTITIRNHSGTDLPTVRRTWGGIGNFDGRGGLGHGVMYCVDRSWWDGWTSYVGWNWAEPTPKSALSRRRRDRLQCHRSRPRIRSRRRPHDLSTEPLLDRTPCAAPGGTQGSYEPMKIGLVRDRDYVLIPPAVWDVLYELYGGGPPLPRMVVDMAEVKAKSTTKLLDGGSSVMDGCGTVEAMARVGAVMGVGVGVGDEGMSWDGASIGGDGVAGNEELYWMPTKLPKFLTVETHPWVLSCHVCDPHQPHRRGNVGAISIRIMATPNQPLWRLFAEIALRLPVIHSSGRDGNGRGRGRLWQKVDEASAALLSSTSVTAERAGREKEGGGGRGKNENSLLPGRSEGIRRDLSRSTISRYGPWVLLCKNRSASFSVLSYDDNSSSLTHSYSADEENMDHEIFQPTWEQYGDGATVESIGLTNGAALMFEYCLFKKDGKVTWPREAAATAGETKRLEAEERSFRLKIRGFRNGDLSNPPTLVPNPRLALIGYVVDCMDPNGRWFLTEISEVEIHKGAMVTQRDKQLEQRRGTDFLPDDVGGRDGGGNGDGGVATVVGEVKVVRVDFTEAGGREEWIPTRSDRLAPAERFTGDGIKCMDNIEVNATASTNANGDNTTTAINNNFSGNNNGSNRTQSLILRKNASPDTATTNTSYQNFRPLSSVCRYPGYGACGLTNLGNSCYINSAVQCISYLPLLRSYLLGGKFRRNGDLNRDNPLGTGGKIFEEFADLMKMMWSGKYGAKTPSRFRGALGRSRSQYAAADQQDAQELLNAMLDILHEDSNRIKNKPYVLALEDSWVHKTDLPRVGTEAWRRFLRRDRSIITDTSMGQVLNSVTCPRCNHTSRNFDPFNMLSVPFPTVAEVTFRCRVVRRVSSLNCPRTLGKTTAGGLNGSNSSSDSSHKLGVSFSLSQSNDDVITDFIVPMGRLTDISDLRREVQNLSGIPSTRFRLYIAEGTGGDEDDKNGENDGGEVEMVLLNDKDGTCLNLAKRSPEEKNGGESSSSSPIMIYAFENTLNPRPLPEPNPKLESKHKPKPKIKSKNKPSNGHHRDATTAKMENSDDNNSPSTFYNNKKATSQTTYRTTPEFLLFRDYGDSSTEGRLYDTDPLLLAKRASRCKWPPDASQFVLGLRVDALDHKRHWWPGSIVSILAPPLDDPTGSPRVKVHFDNFSSKWDLVFSIDHFVAVSGDGDGVDSSGGNDVGGRGRVRRGEVAPIYTHCRPKEPLELRVFHRTFTNIIPSSSPPTTTGTFGTSFFVRLHPEWSTARAAAHVFTQSAMFLEGSPFLGSSCGRSATGENATTKTREEDRFLRRKSVEHRSVLGEIIDILIEADRECVAAACGFGTEEGVSNTTAFDPVDSTERLERKLESLLKKLPFGLFTCENTRADGKPSEEEDVPFAISLVRVVGNYLNARQSLVLMWKGDDYWCNSSGKGVGEAYSKRKQNRRSSTKSSPTPLFYVPPVVGIHRQSHEDRTSHPNLSSIDYVNAGGAIVDPPGTLRLDSCLDEYCKVQRLGMADGWRCPKCRTVREGLQSMTLWRLPDLLTFHLKRFNCSARWREKIVTPVNFPLTGLDLRDWCDKDSPVLRRDELSGGGGVVDDGGYIYDLVGVVNHLGGMTGGHYVANCRASVCSPIGSEEVEHGFNGRGVQAFGDENEGVTSTAPTFGLSLGLGLGMGGWKFGGKGNKDKDGAGGRQSRATAAAALAVADNAEPLWLHFDDDLVEPIPPAEVVTETAYVLFYRRRRISPSNVARYSTIV